ncbi:MAG: rod shape-determining protein MreD [Proteobacteria bacterium]|nr:rod shape-determining protein MreD [Pseudomonadota bacterium]
MKSSFVKVTALHLIAVLFTVFNLTNVGFFPDFIPLFDLMIIYYFTIYRSGVFGWWFLLLLGVWDDSLTGLPIGITAFSYLIGVKIFEILNHRLIIRENFTQIWQQFIAFSFFILAFKWVLLSIYYSTTYSIINPLIQIAISSLLYVVMHRFFDYLSLKLLNPKYSAQRL